MLETLMTAQDRNIIKINKQRVIDPEEILNPPKDKLVPMITRQTSDSEANESDISIEPVQSAAEVD